MAALPSMLHPPRETPIPPSGQVAVAERLATRSPAFDPYGVAAVRSEEGSHALGTRLLDGRYELVRYLDRGASAYVYLAEDNHEDRLVVVKVLEASAAANSELVGRFLRGAHAAMAVRHPNVVQIHEIVEPELEPPYMVMEALVGESLGDYLRRELVMSSGLALRVARHVAAGLHAVHRANVVHRDVKPDNIFLIGRPGAPRSAKILDFGLARVDSTCETGDFVLGTAQYMAPEQILGDGVDARTDIYAFGVVLFRMLTGHLPFDLDLSADLLRHHLSSPAPPPTWLNETLAADVEAIVFRALRKNPINRYASMREVIRDLDRAGRGLPTCALHERLPMCPDLYVPQSAYASRAAQILRRARF
jgi:serine/threonine-protein kinase